jgi:hypothetical protein
MTDWFEPKNFSDWSRRVFALRPILLTLLISSVLVLEMRFDWVERTLGAFLVTTNSERPESGAIWEKGHRTQTAQRTLEKIVTDRQASQREARSAETLSQIAVNLSEGRGAMLSADNFRKLYLKMPRAEAQELIPAFDLLKIAGEGSWHRTYFEKNGNNLTIYLLNAENRVLRQMDVSAEVVRQLDREDSLKAETLEDLPNFKNRIYSAKNFFNALNAFPEEIRRSMILSPDKLLEFSGQILRVGISDEAVSGYIELGFEFANGALRQVVPAQGQEWAVWQLRSYLEGKDAGKDPIKSYQEKQTPR